MTTPEPPVAPVQPVVHEAHGVARTDEYAWLRDLDRPAAREYLAAERAYYEAQVAHLERLRRVLDAEMVGRTVPAEESVGWRRGKHVYSTRTLAGLEYEQLLRRPSGAAAAEPEVLLDENVLAEGSAYLALGICEPSPDGRVLAYSCDRVGDELCELAFRDLATGEDLPDRVARTYYGAAWAADSRTFFYVVPDAAHRPYQVWRHRLGTPSGDDVLVLQEDDDAFEVMLHASRSGGLVVVELVARDSSEVWFVPADRPEQPPTLVAPRRTGIEYRVAHAPRPDGDELLIVTNDGAEEFRLVRGAVATPGWENWAELVGEHPEERLASVDVFAEHVVLGLRRDGSPLLRVVRRDGAETAVDVHPGVPAGTVRLGRNEEYAVGSVRVVVESYSEPPAWFDVDLTTGERTLVRRQDVPGYDRGRYVSQRRTVRARDGAEVPVTLVHRADVPLDGSAPCLLYGYGAYEWCDDPAFDPALPSLLDRGVVFAHAHVRGGGERGRRWWLDGRLQHKQHTFSDFVDVADALAAGVVDGGRIVCRGLSAGGLLMGAVYSQAPRRWAGVVAEVPFVDVVTTMLDETVPLTAQEWTEWGDPRRPEEFAWLLAYSPYDNVPPAAARPPLLVTGAVHDPRVMVWEPAKWVARLRATGSAGPRVLFRVETGAGAHAGPPGRYARLHYEAEVYAWVLDVLGLAGR